ncbi:MAG: ATP-binding protein, partial [Candidatus Limnocylindria bacterium]
MRVQRVIARAFGPFRGETLELAPGMTVVTGPNESGKSTWHAALRLALTGVRRGKGPGTAAERLVAERHRPWDLPDQWEVEARLSLDDGRTIDISQDLAGKVACRAVDVALGRDVSDEILDGTPDASRWLGLTRDTFGATLSVSQAQIMAVADAADDLQDQMQRAAATHGTDATAAEAIARLEQFRRDAVGADTAAAKGPLRTARSRLAAAEARLLEARTLHEEYLGRSAAVEELQARVGDLAQRLAAAEAAVAGRSATAVGQRLARAEALAARHPDPPSPLAARAEQADAVAAGLEAWTARPAAPTLEGATAEHLAAELAALPEVPVGDLRPDPTTVDWLRAMELAEEAIRTLGDRPVPHEPPAAQA